MAKTRKSKNDRELISRKVQQQYQELFSEQNAPPTHLGIREVEALQARLAELEAALEERQAARQEPAIPPEALAARVEPRTTGGDAIRVSATREQAAPSPAPESAPAPDPRIRRNMNFLATFLGVVGFAAVLFYFVLYLQTGVWQILAESGFILLGISMLGIAYPLIRRNRFRAASTWIMVGISLAYATPEVVWKNATAYLLITGLLLLFMIGTSFPPQAMAWFVVPMAYVAYIFAVNQIEPLPRFDINQSPALRVFIPAVTVVIGVWVVLQLVRMVVHYSRLEAASGAPSVPLEGMGRFTLQRFPFWRALSKLVLEPDRTVVGVEARRQAQLLTTLLTILIPLYIYGEAFRATTGRFDTGAFIGYMIALALLGSYGLSRTARFDRGAILSVLALTASVYQGFLLPSASGYTASQIQGALSWMAVPLFLGGIILPLPSLVIYLIGNFAAMLALTFVPGFPAGAILAPAIWIGITSLLLVVGKRFREQVEREARSELVNKNRALEMAESIAASRARNLFLAADVARRLSQLRDLSDMLTETVELIRASFGLYYVQIYLSNPNQTALILKAGTGEVGAELLRRGHRLALAPNSLNGRAAFERRPVIVSDTEESAAFLPNPLLPKTRSEMAIPLISGERVLGVLDMQSDQVGLLNEGNSPVFEALAGQLAIAVQNAHLLTQAQEARAEAEAQARRLTEQGWQDFLDAIERGQRIGFVFDQHQTAPLKGKTLTDPAVDNALQVPIDVSGARLGVIQLSHDPQQTWSEREAEILQAVARQLAQHIDNLRLLAQAERYRAEAEQAVRRLTREGWGSYLQRRSEPAPGYMFDLVEVRVLDPKGNGRFSALKQPLTVRGEVVGELAAEAAMASEEAAEILAAASRQLSAHIENLRLAEEIEQALVRTEQLSRQNELILESAGEGIFGLNEKGEHSFVNPAAAHMLGYSVEELVGRHSHSTWHYQRADGSPYPDEECLIYLSLRDGTVHEGDEYFLRKDGSGFPVTFTSTPMREGGKIVGAVVTFRDITERKQAEERLRLAQQRMQTILETVTLPMVITRLSDNIMTFINQPAAESVRSKYEDVINKPSPNFYYDLEDRKKFIAELRAKGRVSNMAVRLVRSDGEIFWALLSARIFEYQGEPSILTTFADITDRIRAQEDAARRAAELATVAEISTKTATTLDPDQLLQLVTDLTKERFGLYHAHIYLVDEAAGTLLLTAGAGDVGRQLVAERHAIPLDAQRSLVARAARERTAVIVNDVRSEPDFLPNPLLPETRSEMAVPLIVGEQVLGVFDVQSETAGYFTEREANIYTTLAAQVGVALQNARLYAEQTATVMQLRELDRLKSSFLANMSHELRTPLNSILGFADVIAEGLDGPLTEPMKTDLQLIQKNGQHLLHLINDVLDMAKIEAGKLNLQSERFRLHEVLDEVLSITSPLASEKALSLFIEDESDQEVEVFADRTRIRQVMLNLVNNALKFTEKGKISICATRQEERVLIRVRDTGVGIPPDKLEAIFEEFAQVDPSPTRKVGGTGLGLPISRRLVDMHGGRMWAESAGVPGEGSTFYVELPLEAKIAIPVEKVAR